MATGASATPDKPKEPTRAEKWRGWGKELAAERRRTKTFHETHRCIPSNPADPWSDCILTPKDTP